MHYLYYLAASADNIIESTSLPKTKADSSTINTLFLILFGVIGAICLLVVVLSGARYALSKGEPDNIQKAKNELKYALIGLIITALAATIVNFALTKI